MKKFELNRILRKTINESLESKAEEVMEKLYGKQSKLDKNRNGRLDAEDFKILRNKKREMDEETEVCEQCGVGEMREGECTECGAMNETIYEIEVDEEEVCEQCGETDEEIFEIAMEDINESVRFTEEQLITLIEEVVNKEKDNIKRGKSPAGLAQYERVHKTNGKEEGEYMESFMKKFKDYLKDGSKGEFDTNPKKFPKGNGQLEKMATKKYTMSDDGKEFLDDYMRPGMENLVPDEIEYDEKWVGDNIKGSSRTGNNPKWANAEETELGEKLNKKLKDQKYRKAKTAAYRKAKQPVTDGTGENAGHGVNIKLENVNDKKTKILNEEFERMKNLISYSRKTQ